MRLALPVRLAHMVARAYGGHARRRRYWPRGSPSAVSVAMAPTSNGG
jgi:hypothetical protein